MGLGAEQKIPAGARVSAAFKPGQYLLPGNRGSGHAGQDDRRRVGINAKQEKRQGEWQIPRFAHARTDGGKKIPPARRAEVEKEIARQKARIATLEIRGLPERAVVRLDGKEIGKAPIAFPVSVGVGRHTLAASAEGYDPAEKEVTVAGEDQKVVDLVLAKHLVEMPPPVASVVETPPPPIAPVVAMPPPVAPMESPVVGPEASAPVASTAVLPRMRDSKTIWGLSFTLAPWASVDQELFQNGTSVGAKSPPSKDLDVSFGVGAFGAYRINKFLALGGDLDFFLLNLKNVPIDASVKTMSLGPELRLTFPVSSLEFYLRLAGGFAVAFLPDEVAKQLGQANSYSSFAPGYLFNVNPGVMYRTGHMGVFLGFDVVLSKIYQLAGGYTLDVASWLFGLDVGVVFIP